MATVLNNEGSHRSMLDSRTAEILKQAVGAAQAGDMQNARGLAEQGLVNGGDIVALNAFLGMLHARAGDLGSAIPHLKLAHHGRPDDITIACNLVSAQIDSGDLAGALGVTTRDLAFSDPSLRIARYRGFLAQSLEQFEEAVEAYGLVTGKMSRDFESWNNLGNARLALEDFDGSIAALERAISLDRRAAPARLNLATALRSADRATEAEAVLRAAAKDFPSDFRPLHELYVQYRLEMRHEEAVAALEGAITLEPGNADLQLKLGVEYGLLMRTADAERAFWKTLEIDPKMVDAYLGLAIQYEHSNREDQFLPLIRRAEASGLDEGALSLLRALEHRRAGRFEEGLESLKLVSPEIEPERTTHIRATLLDRLGHSDEAFAAFKATAELHQASPSEPLRRAAELRDQVRAEIGLLTPQWVSSWSSDQPKADRPDPVFLVGFPRSGTTLLDTILMGHERTAVLEERPPLNHVDKAVGGLAEIPALDNTGILQARAKYFQEVDEVERVDSSKLLIDKSPLFLHKVPLIQRLFPNARFILAIRHPCDVLLSCYMSNFRLNSAMANFLKLEDAAQFYDLTFQHWERSRELLPVNVHMVVYEELVANVEATVRSLFEFLELDWQDAALDHQRTAKARGLITTASYSQVTEPIYTRAAGRWTRYRDQLEPVLPVLRPWVERFGYTI